MSLFADAQHTSSERKMSSTSIPWPKSQWQWEQALRSFFRLRADRSKPSFDENDISGTDYQAVNFPSRFCV
jgi:hypothetical protein